jgi:tetratricopeptide (TPR) repeat protein
MSGLGRSHQSQNNPTLAMAYFDKAVELSPERSRHLHLAQRAKLHEENQDPDSAIADLEVAVALQPGWYERGWSRWGQRTRRLDTGWRR